MEVQEAEEFEGGRTTAIRLPANWPLHIPKPIKEVKFSDKVVFVYIVDTGVDEYTFDNVWEDGTPRVRQRKPSVKPRVQRFTPSSEVLAHQWAVQLFGGMTFSLPPPRKLTFYGRQPIFEDYSEDEHDEVFDELEMIDIDLSDKKYSFYTHKPLAAWRNDEVTTIDGVGKETVTWSRVDGLLGLDPVWAQYYHVGDVPLRGATGDAVDASVDCALAAPIRLRPKFVTKWIVDTGASMHLMELSDYRKGGFGRESLATPVWVTGVGGQKRCDFKALVYLEGFPATIRPVVGCTPFNLMSVDQLGRENGVDFINMASKGLPPYLVFPDDSAVICSVEDGVPI